MSDRKNCLKLKLAFLKKLKESLVRKILACKYVVPNMNWQKGKPPSQNTSHAMFKLRGLRLHCFV